MHDCVHTSAARRHKRENGNDVITKHQSLQVCDRTLMPVEWTHLSLLVITKTSDVKCIWCDPLLDSIQLMKCLVFKCGTLLLVGLKSGRNDYYILYSLVFKQTVVVKLSLLLIILWNIIQLNPTLYMASKQMVVCFRIQITTE